MAVSCARRWYIGCCPGVAEGIRNRVVNASLREMADKIICARNLGYLSFLTLSGSAAGYFLTDKIWFALPALVGGVTGAILETTKRVSIEGLIQGIRDAQPVNQGAPAVVVANIEQQANNPEQAILIGAGHPNAEPVEVLERATPEEEAFQV